MKDFLYRIKEDSLFSGPAGGGGGGGNPYNGLYGEAPPKRGREICHLGL